MEIIIENCSSPGASFTDHTNKTLLCCNELISENVNKIVPFITFRRELETKKNINDNNARNIYPFLRNCGFINYEKSTDLCYGNLFTKLGKAYIKILESIQILEDTQSALSDEEKQALNNLKIFQQELIIEGIKNLLKIEDCNYRDELIACGWYLHNYNSIDKKEFAYFLFEYKKSKTDYLKNMSDNIKKYRAGNLDFEVKVDVRDDEKKSSTGRRLEGIGYLTSYNYFIGLYAQAGFLEKNKNRYEIVISKKDLLKAILNMEETK